ncbi:peptidase C15, pyroglutamyl peptidase I-like protein [Rhizoctonia solani]|nr:peptidase C15, pyroglutamyl peptidase I-like protein [Rhizoctonia solani]
MPSIPTGEKRKLKVLITGFGPFKHVTTNPSWLAAEPLNNQTFDFGQVEVHISALEIPTVYSAVLNTIPALHASKQYDAILHFGVGHPGGFAIESCAHKSGYDGQDAEDRKCNLISVEGGEKRGFGAGFEQFGDLHTEVDVDGLVEHLKSKGFEHTAPSNDAGRYLCDFIYFCSLACARKEGDGVKVLFTHVPPLGQPYDIPDMTKAIEGIIEYIALQS